MEIAPLEFVMVRPRPVEVRVLNRYGIWLRFSDGCAGEVDLTPLAGQGVFAAWLKDGFFEQAFISAEARTVSWPGELDLDPDVLYSQATGKPLPARSDAA